MATVMTYGYRGMWAVVSTEGICGAKESPTQSERRAEFVVATTATGIVW